VTAIQWVAKKLVQRKVGFFCQNSGSVRQLRRLSPVIRALISTVLLNTNVTPQRLLHSIRPTCVETLEQQLEKMFSIENRKTGRCWKDSELQKYDCTTGDRRRTTIVAIMNSGGVVSYHRLVHRRRLISPGATSRGAEDAQNREEGVRPRGGEYTGAPFLSDYEVWASERYKLYQPP